jgi:hypothetical protein
MSAASPYLLAISQFYRGIERTIPHMGMPVDDLLGLAPNVLDQLTAELVRQHDERLIADRE